LLDAFDEKIDGRRRVDSFPSIKPEDAGMDKNARLAVVPLWVGGVKREEKKDAEPELKDLKTPTWRFPIGKHLNDLGLICVKSELGGEKQPAMLLVKDKQGIREGLADRVTPGALAYLDHRIPTFTPSEGSSIKQLDLTRGGETYQLQAEKAGILDSWK